MALVSLGREAYSRSHAGVLAVIHEYRKLVIQAGIAGIQKPWMVTCRLSKCLIEKFPCPQFHIPVDWIPAIPAGMTVFWLGWTCL